ncbi:uncharacterized protein VP01_1139g1 [Puccinia sorghi]|uniref:CCHC-type domain-containing protein n=1 Tax=Puccinia sorghi TaxID=27349 RepID=A0A0L6VS04_9BASI|nr:uncharacterized protein VP01_1139g1 [Puccinia sorghi]
MGEKVGTAQHYMHPCEGWKIPTSLKDLLVISPSTFPSVQSQTGLTTNKQIKQQAACLKDSDTIPFLTGTTKEKEKQKPPGNKNEKLFTPTPFNPISYMLTPETAPSAPLSQNINHNLTFNPITPKPSLPDNGKYQFFPYHPITLAKPQEQLSTSIEENKIWCLANEDHKNTASIISSAVKLISSRDFLLPDGSKYCKWSLQMVPKFVASQPSAQVTTFIKLLQINPNDYPTTASYAAKMCDMVANFKDLNLSITKDAIVRICATVRNHNFTGPQSLLAIFQQPSQASGNLLTKNPIFLQSGSKIIHQQNTLSFNAVLSDFQTSNTSTYNDTAVVSNVARNNSCHICRQLGHWANECPHGKKPPPPKNQNLPSSQASFQQPPTPFYNPYFPIFVAPNMVPTPPTTLFSTYPFPPHNILTNLSKTTLPTTTNFIPINLLSSHLTHTDHYTLVNGPM